jgi:hypothetical protein
MPSNPADHSGRPRRRIRDSRGADAAAGAELAAVEELLTAACPEPALPRDLVHSICTHARRQRETQKLWARWIAGSGLATVLLVAAVCWLPDREDSAATAETSAAPGSPWNSAAAAFMPPAGSSASAGDGSYVDQALENRSRLGNLLRSGGEDSAADSP